MTSDTLLKYLAVVFLFIVMVGAFIIAGIEIVLNEPPNPYAISILGTGLGYAMTAAGVAHGSSIVANATANATNAVTTAQQSVNGNGNH